MLYHPDNHRESYEVKKNYFTRTFPNPAPSRLKSGCSTS
jgi:hypothetical protein